MKLLLILLLLVLPALAYSQFTFTTNNGAITITAYTGTNALLAIPSITNGYPVVDIGEQAFGECTNLVSITIPDSVTNVGDYAFEDCTNLTSAYFLSNAPSADEDIFSNDPVTVYYPSGVTGWTSTFGGALTMEESPPADFIYGPNSSSITIARYNGTNEVVVIPDFINGHPVTGIGQFAAFGLCTSITIPSNVTNIALDAFSHCFSLTNLTICDGLISIADQAFIDCSSLRSISLPDSVISISETAFLGCYGLTNFSVAADNPAYSSTNGVLFDKAQDTLVECPAGILAYAVPNTVTSIGGLAFNGCIDMTNVTIPDSVTNISTQAFYICNGLTSITIPDSVTSIGSSFFVGDSLTNISVAADNPAYSSTNGVLFDKAQDTIIEFPPGLNINYIIPNSVTNIAGEAFDGCMGLSSVIIPPGVTSIGDDAFLNCYNLTTVYFLGNAPTVVSQYAFSDDPATFYYLPGTIGWAASFGGAVLWNPQATALATSGQFGFNITGLTNVTIVVEACTNLANPVWLPVSTNTLSGSGTSSFSDPQWTNYPNRYYGFSMP